jgi:hypothetical protein
MAPTDPWERKDAWLGALIFAGGALITVYAFLAMRNDLPSILWWLGWIVGPLLLLVGANAIVRALRASGRDE